MKPFLHLATRDLDAAARDEYDAILRCTGLEPAQLVQLRADAGPLPAIRPEDYSGAFIGGSSFNTSDAEKCDVQVRAERDLGRFVELGVSGELPALGLCYGMGIVARHLGGTVDTTFGEPTSAVEIEVTPEGRDDPLFAGLPETFWVCTGHKEACSALPEGAVILAGSAACPVQAIRVGEACYATQFHAELDPERLVDRMVLYRDAGYFPAHEFDLVAAQVRGAGVAHWPAQIVRGFAERFAR